MLAPIFHAVPFPVTVTPRRPERAAEKAARPRGCAAADAESSVDAFFGDDAVDRVRGPSSFWTMPRPEFADAEVAAAEVAAIVCDDAAEDPANSVLFSCPSHNDCTVLSSSDDEEDLHVLAYLLTNYLTN